MIRVLGHADRVVIGVAAPLITTGFGFSNAAFGWILAASAFTCSPFGFIDGGWVDTWTRPR
ncbi:hypothetical protein [Actinoalloteichus spitiensis]|uniref:hypothetical protein n=1 Tax=Actinoalloteichus spitiensis TaxID=252394 RepID=UPI0003628824|nr:hypothetical protein [Actinoalloteichus spitiensis]